jgi:hypothetical protein
MIIDMTAPCPMGCGPTLHLSPAGVIRCLDRQCPNPMAAQKILENADSADLVQIDAGGFSILHPLRERLDNGLFNCPVNMHLAALREPPAGPGFYYARLDEAGLLELEPAPAGKFTGE